MQVLYHSCCGMDVHKRFVVACLLWQDADGKPHKELRRYSTMTGDLLQCIAWLSAKGCSHVAMESTGVYTPPIMLPKM